MRNDTIAFNSSICYTNGPNITNVHIVNYSVYLLHTLQVLGGSCRVMYKTRLHLGTS